MKNFIGNASKGFLALATDEDFGITMVEAQAARPQLLHLMGEDLKNLL